MRRFSNAISDKHKLYGYDHHDCGQRRRRASGQPLQLHVRDTFDYRHVANLDQVRQIVSQPDTCPKAEPLFGQMTPTF